MSLLWAAQPILSFEWCHPSVLAIWADTRSSGSIRN